MPNTKRLFESTVQMTDSYYSARLQPDSAAAEVDHASVTACNKQRASVPSYRARCGSAHCRIVNAVSSGWTAIWSKDTHGRPCIQSVCNSLDTISYERCERMQHLSDMHLSGVHCTSSLAVQYSQSVLV